MNRGPAGELNQTRRNKMADGFNALLQLETMGRLLEIARHQGPDSSVGRLRDVATKMPHVYFVKDTTGSDNNGGWEPDRPLATINAAIGKCTANRGDIVAVMPGHAESITGAAAINLSVAGVTVMGFGVGSLKPTITFNTPTTTTIKYNASNCMLKNLRLTNNIDSLAMFLDCAVDYCYAEDLDFDIVAAKEAVSFIQLTTTKDNFFFKRLTARQGSDPTGTDGGAGTGFCYMVDSENIYFEDCDFYGNFETAIFHNRTTAAKNLWVINCRGIQLLSGAEPFQLVAGCNGAMSGGGFITPAETAATEATLVGTLGDSFFILPPGNFGNDGGAGGQGGIIVATAS
eukprot:GHVU01215037.1.p2 GENE.GHVU01215037.1~~GHVU01215037.1.p2  ORF type:complete len:344 (+),score=72.00 GHVU01215037.1:1551-2582(+)